jgi:hypothetical protein
MKQVPSSRQAIESWHLHEKATIDHLVRLLTEPKSRYGYAHCAFTSTGLTIEDHIRKAWRRETLGLAMF